MNIERASAEKRATALRRSPKKRSTASDRSRSSQVEAPKSWIGTLCAAVAIPCCARPHLSMTRLSDDVFYDI